MFRIPLLYTHTKKNLHTCHARTCMLFEVRFGFYSRYLVLFRLGTGRFCFVWWPHAVYAIEGRRVSVCSVRLHLPHLVGCLFVRQEQHDTKNKIIRVFRVALVRKIDSVRRSLPSSGVCFGLKTSMMTNKNDVAILLAYCKLRPWLSIHEKDNNNTIKKTNKCNDTAVAFAMYYETGMMLQTERQIDIWCTCMHHLRSFQIATIAQSTHRLHTRIYNIHVECRRAVAAVRRSFHLSLQRRMNSPWGSVPGAV